jgi:hypothetical protein
MSARRPAPSTLDALLVDLAARPRIVATGSAWGLTADCVPVRTPALPYVGDDEHDAAENERREAARNRDHITV